MTGVESWLVTDSAVCGCSDPERKLFVWLSGAANSTAVPKNKGFVRGETVFQGE